MLKINIENDIGAVSNLLGIYRKYIELKIAVLTQLPSEKETTPCLYPIPPRA